MQDAELLWLADQNLAEFCRTQSRSLPTYRLEEDDRRLLVASGTRFPGGVINCAFPLGDGPVDAPALVDDAARFFAPLDRGYSIYAPTHRGPDLARVCGAANYPQLADSPGMVLTQRIAPAEPGAGVELRFASDARGAADFTAVCASAYETMQQPASVTQKLFSMPERWLRPNYHVLVLYEHERPVCAAVLLFSQQIAGVYWVATIAEARGRGYAAMIMRRLSNHAFDAGARLVVLQASPFGEPIYRKLGYREFTRYPFFLVMKQKP